METIVQNVWTKTKVLIKALVIGGIVLVLQIPTFFVQDLIKEREQRQKEAIAEVSSKWAAKQNIAGPVLVFLTCPPSILLKYKWLRMRYLIF